MTGRVAASRRPGLTGLLSEQSLGWALAAVGVVAVVAAVAADWSDARAAMDQVWSPFVLVAGLLLIGLIADEDGLFAWAGHHLARGAPTGGVLFLGATLIVTVVTAVLNLDTAVAFLTPVLIYSARSRGKVTLLCCTAASCWPTRDHSFCPARISPT